MYNQDLFRPEGAAGGVAIRLPVPDADLRFIREFVPPALAEAWFTALGRDGEVKWRQDRLRMYGREVDVPRLNAWYGDPGVAYTYSGIAMDPLPWTPLLEDIRERVSATAAHGFNSVLINFYRDGNDSVAWHADDEPELGRKPVIASLSLGSERIFLMRHRNHRDRGVRDVRLPLPPGSLLIMAGETQANWLHQVPRMRGRNDPGPRINLTFRRILTRPGHHTETG